MGLTVANVTIIHFAMSVLIEPVSQEFGGGRTTVSTAIPYSYSISGAFDQHRGLALGIGLVGVGIGTAMVPTITQVLLDQF